MMITGELLIRVLKPQQLTVLHPEIWEPVPIYGWRHAVEVDTTVNTGEGLVHFRTNAEGHRINVGLTPPSEFEKRLLVLGDSFMEAMQVENREATPELLKSGLAKNYNLQVGVDNTSVGGWDPVQYLWQARESLSRKKYDLGIVFLYVGNDVINYTPDDMVILRHEGFPPKKKERHPWRFPQTLEWNEIIHSVLYPFNELMERVSHLYVFLKNASQTLLARMGLTAYYFPSVFMKEQAHSGRWDLTTEVCLEIQQEFDRHGIKLFFVLLPTPQQVHDRFFKRYVEYFDIDPESVDLYLPNKILPKKFEVDGMTLYDLLEPLKEYAKNGESLYGDIDTHLNRRGHEAVTEKLVPIVYSYLLDKK